jgi:hypothetical protein
MPIKNFPKDPDAILDFEFDWSDWLQSGETIASYDITVETGIVNESDSEADGKVTVWLSGGMAGENYIVACEIDSSDSRTDERSMRILVADR